MAVAPLNAELVRFLSADNTVLRLMPPALLAWVVERAVLRREDRQQGRRYPAWRQVLPTMRFDFHVVSQRSAMVQRYAQVTQPVLLLGGAKTPRYLRDALTALQQALPQAQRQEFAGLDHSGVWNADLGGFPTRVAPLLRDYFCAA